MPLDLSSLIPVYEDAIDDIINQMGKECRLVFPAILVNADEDLTDPARGDNKKPFYKGEVPLQQEQRETMIIKFLIKHNPSDYQSFGTRIENPQDILRIKGYLSDVPHIKRCEYLVPDINVENTIEGRYRLIREPVPQGLKNNRYFVAFFVRI